MVDKATGRSVELTGKPAEAMLMLIVAGKKRWSHTWLARRLGWTEAETVEVLHELQRLDLIGHDADVGKDN